MPLLQSIGGIFLENGSDEERAAFSNSLERFLVPDIGTNRNELSVVLLDESPHTHEVCYRYPLAGNAGRHVRDVFNEEARRMHPNELTRRVLPCGPIGRFVHDGHLGRLDDNGRRHDFLQLGIMNVSQLPFQSKAYDCVPWTVDDCRDRAGWNSYIKCMEYIKKESSVVNYQGFGSNGCLQTEINQLRDAIAEDLRGRLEALRGNRPDVLLVRCGEVAQNFYTKADVDMTPSCCLPHPTRRADRSKKRKMGWLTLNCQEERCLQKIIECIWPSPG